MKKLRLLSLIVLVAAILISVGAYAKHKQDDHVYPPKAHHVIYAVWHLNPDRTIDPKSLILRVRDVEESGAWQEWGASQYWKNPKTGEVPTEGHTHLGKREEARGPATDLYKSIAWFHSRPNFLREEKMLGYKCFTLNLGERKEVTFTQEYGFTPFKYVDGDFMMEALKVY